MQDTLKVDFPSYILGTSYTFKVSCITTQTGVGDKNIWSWRNGDGLLNE